MTQFHDIFCHLFTDLTQTSSVKSLVLTSIMSTQNTNSTTNNKPKTKIVLQRVLEINDSLKLHLYGTQLILEAGLMLNLLSHYILALEPLIINHIV